MRDLLLFLCALGSLLFVSCSKCGCEIDPVFKWDSFNYSIGGMKIWKNHMYVYIPRRTSDIPWTLARLDLSGSKKNPEFEPFPNAAIQKPNECNFNSIQGMEIDPEGRMWLLDNSMNLNDGESPKLIVLNLKENGSVIRKHVFPDNLFPFHSRNLVDIVLNHADSGYAYIYNLHGMHSKLLVYSVFEEESRPHEDEILTAKLPESGMDVVRKVLALSPASVDEKYLYFLHPEKNELYDIPIKAMRKWGAMAEGENFRLLSSRTVSGFNPPSFQMGCQYSQLCAERIVHSGTLLKSSMVMLADGSIVFGVVNRTVGFRWNTTLEYTEEHRFGAMSTNCGERLHTFGFDENGHLWYFHEFIRPNSPRYALVKSQYKYPKDYQYLNNGSSPKLSRIQPDFAHCEARSDSKMEQKKSPTLTNNLPLSYGN